MSLVLLDSNVSLDATRNTSPGFCSVSLQHFSLHGLHGPEEMHPQILRGKVYKNIEVGYASATFLDSKKKERPTFAKKVGPSVGLHTESANDLIPQILLIPLFIVGLTTFHQSLGMVTYTLLPIPMSLIHVSFFQKVVSDPKLEGVHDDLRLEKWQNKMMCSVHPSMHVGCVSFKKQKFFNYSNISPFPVDFRKVRHSETSGCDFMWSKILDMKNKTRSQATTPELQSSPPAICTSKRGDLTMYMLINFGWHGQGNALKLFRISLKQKHYVLRLCYYAVDANIKILIDTPIPDAIPPQEKLWTSGSPCTGSTKGLRHCSATCVKGFANRIMRSTSESVIADHSILF